MSHTTARHRRALAIAASAALVLTACGGDDEPVPVADAASDGTEAAATPAFGLVSPATAAELAQNDDITVIDVRTPEEFEQGHLDGAAMIDFYADTFADEIAALDRGGEYLIYCRSGNRSGQTYALMQELGFDRVYDLDGGVVAWAAAGLSLGVS